MSLQQRVRLANGLALDVRESGSPHGRPLILLHGVTDSALSMAPFMAELDPSIRAIAVTVRGHGDSDKPAAYGFGDFVGDLVQLLDRLGLTQAAVLGHSMGSMIAQRLAMARPDRVSALVLVGAMPGLKGNVPAREFYDTAVADLADPVDPALAQAFQESTLAHPVPADFLRLVVSESVKVPARVWRACFDTMLPEDLEPDLKRIACPTLLVWGDQDGFALRDDQERLRRGIAGAVLETLAGHGHAPHWEAPARVARRASRFLLDQAAAASA